MLQKKYADLFDARMLWFDVNRFFYPNTTEQWPEPEDFGYTKEEVEKYLTDLRSEVKEHMETLQSQLRKHPKTPDECYKK